MRQLVLWLILLFGGTFAPLIAAIDWANPFLAGQQQPQSYRQILSLVYRDLHEILESLL